MKTRNLLAAFFLTSFLVLFLSGCQEETPFTDTGITGSTVLVEPQFEADDLVVPGEYIVLFKEGQVRSILDRAVDTFATREAKIAFVEENEPEVMADIQEVLAGLGIPASNILEYYTASMTGVGVRLSEEELLRVQQSPLVEQLEYNRRVELEPGTAEEEEAFNKGYSDVVPCAIQQAGGYRTVSSSTKRWIWIVDSGIDLDHPDLNVVTKYPYARSFSGGSANDCQGHGTHVAGIAAARKNGFGVVGVAAGAPVVPVKVMYGCSNSGFDHSILAGIDHVAKYAIAGDVVNLSLGKTIGYGCSSRSMYKRTLEKIGRAGVWMAIAAGNEGQHSGFVEPACLSLPRGYTVSAMNCYGYWGNLNYGAPPVDYVAVGINVLSTYKYGGYTRLTGTSMAAPVVAGILYARNRAPRTRGYVWAGNQRYRAAGL